MIFVETLPLIYSIIFSLSVSSVIFFWRYSVLKRNSIKALYSLPSVIVVGQKLSGKSSIIKLMTNEDVSGHMFIDDITLYRLMGRKGIIQFVELPEVSDKISRLKLKKFKKMNLKHVVYVFDVSNFSAPIVDQMKDLEAVKKMFSGVPLSIVANKVNDSKNKKLKQLRKKFKKLYQIPTFDSKKIKVKKPIHLKKELEDVNRLIDDISIDITREKPINTIK